MALLANLGQIATESLLTRYSFRAAGSRRDTGRLDHTLLAWHSINAVNITALSRGARAHFSVPAVRLQRGFIILRLVKSVTGRFLLLVQQAAFLGLYLNRVEKFFPLLICPPIVNLGLSEDVQGRSLLLKPEDIPYFGQMRLVVAIRFIELSTDGFQLLETVALTICFLL